VPFTGGCSLGLPSAFGLVRRPGNRGVSFRGVLRDSESPLTLRHRSSTGGLVELPEIDETWERLAMLPRDQRVALVLRFYEDLPDAEIARVMDCRPATVRTRIHRALTVLRKEMTP
jgi:DNA-directed RNA polymerase specialized sigma24 family protein